MFFLYEVALHLVFLVSLPFFLVIGFLRGKYLANFRERFGRYAHGASAHDLWIHAVSVGEVMAARTIFDELRLARPALTLVVTTTTITGQQTARRLFKGATVTYFPFDFARTVRRFLDHHRPRALLLVETEIWPNVSRISVERGMAIILANGRISDRSFSRYRAVRLVVRRILNPYASILVREPLDRERFIAIGAPAEKVHVAGNVKFDYAPDQASLDVEPILTLMFGSRPVFVLGSTVAGEDEALLPVVGALIASGAFVVIAPRKPERFDVVDGLLSAASVRYLRRSEWEGKTSLPVDLLLLDSIGELARVYRFATAAFVGGSLLPGTGGHNPIEPAAVGVPVAFGPYMSNFREIAATFLSSGGAIEVADASELQSLFLSLMSDAPRRNELAACARSAVERNQGAARRIAAVVAEAIG